MQKKRWLFLFLALFATFFIFSNSMQVAENSSQQSGRLVALLEFITASFGGTANTQVLTVIIRKGAHITEFFIQSFFVGLIFVYGRKPFAQSVIYVLFFGLLTGCVDEFIQSFVNGRGSMVSDIFVDFSGVLLAALFCVAIDHFRKRRIQ